MPYLMNSVEWEREATTGLIFEDRRIEIRHAVSFDALP